MKPIKRFRKTTRIFRQKIYWIAETHWYPQLNLIVVNYKTLKPEKKGKK